MERKGLIPLICGVCGILAGIGMICGAVLGDAFPRPLWILTAIGFFISGAGNVYNFLHLRGKDKEDV